MYMMIVTDDLQMFRTVKEKRLRRSLSVALFHPTSKARRLHFINAHQSQNQSQSSSENAIVSELTVDSEVIGVATCIAPGAANPFRAVLIELMKCGKDRFALMSSLVIESFIRQDLTACAPFLQLWNSLPSDSDGIEATKSVVELFQMLNIWVVDGNSSGGLERGDDFDAKALLAELSTTAVESSAASKSVPADVSALKDTGKSGADSCNSTGNDLMGALDAEVEGVAVAEETVDTAHVVNGDGSGVRPEAAEAEAEVAKKDYKAEMEEYTYGAAECELVATRGRGGSIDLETGPQTADALAVSAMKSIVECDGGSSSDAGVDAGSGSGGESGPGQLLSGLFGVLNDAPLYSLAVLQVITGITLSSQLSQETH
jgi:hypothetical protein